MNIILDDAAVKEDLYPFSATRHVADIRVGILTIREKWTLLEENNFIFEKEESIVIPANIIPTIQNVHQIFTAISSKSSLNNEDAIKYLLLPWQIFELNDWALRKDFELITGGRISQLIPVSNKVAGSQNIFIEAGAVIEHCVINASTGPVYIGKNATIMEGCLIRGPFAICENATLKMGSKIYGATTIGPSCVAGGEIKNSMLFANSNKAHDGYLGDSVIGEWCNLGAGSSNSNIKNTAAPVKVWNNKTKTYLEAGLKCGLLMGDYSRAAINTSFNTGTVVGVCCNIFGQDFPPKLVADFSWGNQRYLFEKVLQDIDNWKQLKGERINEAEKNILKDIYNNKTT